MGSKGLSIHLISVLPKKKSRKPAVQMGDELLTFLSQSIPILQSLSWLHITSLVFLMFWEITIQQIWRLISGRNKGSKAYVQTSRPQKNCASDFSAVTTFSALGSWCQMHLMIPCCDRTTNSPKIPWHTKLRDQEFRSRVTQPFLGMPNNSSQI